jgi:hypothetical protein
MHGCFPIFKGRALYTLLDARSNLFTQRNKLAYRENVVVVVTCTYSGVYNKLITFSLDALITEL